jgi:hypothetical protein
VGDFLLYNNISNILCLDKDLWERGRRRRRGFKGFFGGAKAGRMA